MGRGGGRRVEQVIKLVIGHRGIFNLLILERKNKEYRIWKILRDIDRGILYFQGEGGKLIT